MSLSARPLNWTLTAQAAWLDVHDKLVVPAFEHIKGRLPAGFSLAVNLKAGEDFSALAWQTLEGMPLGSQDQPWLHPPPLSAKTDQKAPPLAP